jgi:cyclomaltodextrinase
MSTIRALVACMLLLVPAAARADDTTPRTCRAAPLGERELFLRGGFAAWNAVDAQRFDWACDRYELVTRLDGAQRFKVGDADWSADADFGRDDTAPAGPPWRLAPKGGDLSHDFAGPVRLVLAMPTDAPPTLDVTACDAPPHGDTVLFLRGTMNGWTALEDFGFRFHCDAYYLNVETTGRHEFKLADAGGPRHARTARRRGRAPRSRRKSPRRWCAAMRRAAQATSPSSSAARTRCGSPSPAASPR